MSRRFRRNRRNRILGLRILNEYAEAAVAENPNATQGQLENMIQADIESDFDDRPLLKLLIDLLKEFLPLILSSLMDD